MDLRDKQSITHNLVALVQQTNLRSLLPNLLEKRVFSQRMMEKYMQERTTESQRKQELYMDIQTRGPDAYGKLLESLMETGHFDLARTLRPNVDIQAHITARSRILDDALPTADPMPHSTVPICLPQYLVEEEDQLQTRLYNLALIHPESVLNLGTQPLRVSVKQATLRMDQPTPKNIPVYPMGSRPKGYFFMINNVQFVNDIEKMRRGAEVDEKNLIDLFTGLGYIVINERDQGLADMKRKIEEFAKRQDHSRVDSCVVAILSHGRVGDATEATNIIAADGGELSTSWVVDSFRTQNCPNLESKPKIFIFQTCRGITHDYGVKMMAGRTLRDGSASTMARSQADVLIAYSTLPGYTSNRDRYLGTWFIQAICAVFMEHAHDTDIEDMLKLVDLKLALLTAEDGTLQTSCYESRGFRKFYFNPGLYDVTTTASDQLPPPAGPQG